MRGVHQPTESEGMMENVDILIQHGILLTLNKDRQIITDGAVAIRKDRIVAVGKTANLREKFKGHENHRCIDARW